MVNTYGYSRKTREEDEAILAAVKHHHDAVAAKGYLVVFTSLVGSQNYDLDDKDSDIDTYSFIFPPLSDLALGKPPQAGMFELKDGHCNYKDIRIALDLLKRPSPNSVEYFTSKYKIYNPIFEPILYDYLDYSTNLWYMIHCDYKHMLAAIAGMAHQLPKRNLTPGKRFSHILRLDNMTYHFLNSGNPGAVLDMRMGGDRDLALITKRDTTPEHEENYNRESEKIADKLNEIASDFKLNEDNQKTQQIGLALIDSFQWKLFKKYLMETNK